MKEETHSLKCQYKGVQPFVKVTAYELSSVDCSYDKTSGYYGETATLTANAAPAGYNFSGWNITGSQMTGNSFRFQGDVTAKAGYSAIPVVYNLTLQTDGHGTLTANKVTGYAGDIVTLNPTYNNYYRFNNYSVTGGTINGNTFTFENSNATAKANFKVNNVTITGTWDCDPYTYSRPTYNSSYNSWEYGTCYPKVRAVTGSYLGTIGENFERSYMSSWAMSAQPIVYITGTNGKDKYVSAYFDNSNVYAYGEKDVYVHGTNQVVGTTTGTRKLGCSGYGTGTTGMTNPNIKFEVGEPTTTHMPSYGFGGGWTATGIAK